MEGITVRLHHENMNWWLKLPATEEALQSALREMGAEDGSFTIDRCRTDFGGKLDGLIVDGDLAAVNYLAARLAEITPAHFQKLEAVLDSPLRHAAAENIGRVIDFTYNPDVYDLIPGIRSAEDLARHYIFDSGMVDMPRAWAEGINLPEFGKHLETCQPGFYIGGGYLTATGVEWQPLFEKSGIIPPEYRIGPEEQAAPPTPESYPAVYPHTEETARQNGELDLYAESLALNVRCALAIEEAVRRKPDFDSPRLGHSAADCVLREYGAGRVLAVLAHTVRERDDGMFFTPGNREWAKNYPAPPPSARARFTVEVHPAIADSFTILARRAALELERPDPSTEKLSVIGRINAARRASDTRKDMDERKPKKDKGGPEL